MDALDYFYTDHPFVLWIDTRQRRRKDILNISQKVPIFGLDDYQNGEYRFTQISCANV